MSTVGFFPNWEIMKTNNFVLKNLTDIKIFILFLLDTVRYPIDLSTINKIILDNIEDVTYDYEQALNELTDSGHLLFDEFDGERYYMISDSGHMVSAELYDTLDPTLREQSAACAAKYVSLSKSGATVSTSIEELDTKRFRVSFFARENGCDVLSLSLVVASRAQAEQMVAHYEKKPDEFYKGIFFCATGKLEFLS